MARLSSALCTTDESYEAACSQMHDALARIRALEQRIREHGQQAAGRFDARGALVPRERVARLLDPGAPFMELSTLAGFRMHDDDGEGAISGGGNIAGIGEVSGVRCMVLAHDSAIKGGIVSPLGLQKTLRAQRIAMDNRLPVVMLVESGGANLLHQSEIFVEGGRTFCNMARMSAAGIPQITVVHGSSTAGGAYIPGLSDYVVAVRDSARIFLAGPPLVKAALAEEADEEELGGAEMHATLSGSVEYVADSDEQAIETARQIVAQIGWGTALRLPGGSEPLYSPEELMGIVSENPRQSFEMREVLARIVDASEFLEFKAGFGADTLCGHAAICGERIGVIGNSAPIMPDGSAKAGQFIQLCCQSRLPIIYLMNTTGYMVGKAAEQAGAIKHGAKMIQAVANATVPQISLVIGGGYGAGYYGMCGRSMDPRFLFSWPSARVAVMGGDQAASVMEIITRAKMARKGQAVDEAALSQMSKAVKEQLMAESDVLFSSARLWNDGVIDPRDSRAVLASCLAICKEGDGRQLAPSSFGVARF